MKRFKSIGVVLVLALALTMTIPVGYVAATENHHDYHFGHFIIDPIKTDAGYVAGTMFGDIGKEVRIYRGIPYAAPPVGNLRWKPPQPVVPWSGIRESTKFNLWSPQNFPLTYLGKVLTDADMSEDCLYLNVLTPAKKTTDRLPVMFWIHGGGLTSYAGTLAAYHLTNLPDHGVVVVTVTHRLGAIGYMAHPELTQESPEGVSGNYGQLDLIAALKWVKKNIAAFGGDPKRVTIFGESGGGSKVSGLMASPLAKGLFHRAICESGFGGGTPLATTEQYGVNLMNKVGASSIAEMRAKSWQEIILASVAPGSGYTTSQTVDGWFLQDTIAKTFQAGRQNDVPFIIGMNEGDLASVFNTAVSVVPTITPPLHSKFYAYLFTHVPSNWKAEGQKAYHTLELNYIFGDLPSITLRFGGPYVLPTLTNPDPGLGELDDWLQDAMATIWTQFAATGTPSVKGLVRWPAYDYRTDQYLKIDVPLEVKTGFSTLQCYSPGGRNCE